MPAVGRNSVKPKSLVEHLSDQAPKRAVNDIVSLDRYLMSAELLLKQAADYRRIGDEEQLYVMLLRFASLVVETLPTHRDFRDTNADYKALKKDLMVNYLPELERLKVSLRLKDRIEPPAAASRNRPADAVQLSVSALPQLNWVSSSGVLAAAPSAPPPPPPRPPPAAAAAAADLVVLQGRSPPRPPRQDGDTDGDGGGRLRVDDLLEVMRMASHQPPAPCASSEPAAEPYTSAAAVAAATASLPSAPYLDLPQPKYTHSYSTSTSSGRHALFSASPASSTGVSAGGLPPSSRLSRSEPPPPQQQQRGISGGSTAGALLPRYPTLDACPSAPLATAAMMLGSDSMVPMHVPIPPAVLEQQQQQLAMAMAVPPYSSPTAGPSLGPQEVPVGHLPASTYGLPDTCRTPHGVQPPQPLPPQSSTPSADGPSPGGPKQLLKRAALRDLHVSLALMQEFLAYAASNTARGIESCGILAGRLLADDSRFAITTLIIPKQQGTSDTVTALNEEEIFEAQFERELYPLGWIHTHPTQTCFLSSVDVHTQCGYQTMLDEAVAIVMAPSDASKKCGIFRLSTPGGLLLVQKCAQRGFHMHPPTDTGQELYQLCGHVFINERTKHEVLDLR